MKRWVRQVGGRLAVLTEEDPVNVKASVAGVPTIFTREEWERFPLYDGPLVREAVGSLIDIHDRAT